MLVVICGLIAAPSMVVMVLLSGWVQYLFAGVAAINVAVPVVAYLAYRMPVRLPDDQPLYARAPQIAFDDVTLPLPESVPVEKVSDKV